MIDKLVPPPPKAPPQVIIEQYPQLPPKPRDVIIERWLPQPPRQRRILYERLPPAQAPPNSRPIIVQYGPPHVRVQREVIATPGTQLPYPQVSDRSSRHRSSAFFFLRPAFVAIVREPTSFPIGSTRLQQFRSITREYYSDAKWTTRAAARLISQCSIDMRLFAESISWSRLFGWKHISTSSVRPNARTTVGLQRPR